MPKALEQQDLLVSGQDGYHTHQIPARVNPIFTHPEERRLRLPGTWRFALDPEDRGLCERWFERPGRIADPIEVPGCWQGQGFGGDGLDELWDFKLRTRVFRATYRGTGWYANEFRVPTEWRGQRIRLNLGGVHPSGDVWVNGTKVGETDLPFVPRGFDITDLVGFNEANSLAIRVHEKNRQFGLAFNWQGNWSGLYRGVELTATGLTWIEQLRLYPDAETGALRVVGRIAGDLTTQGSLCLALAVRPTAGTEPGLAAEIPVAAADVDWTGAVGSPQLWSPDAANLFRVDAVLRRPTPTGDRTGGKRECFGRGTSELLVLDARSERVGFVKLGTDGPHFLINGEPYYMRGSGDFVSCPETGCPDTNRERWRRKLRALREYGYNYVRCQSYLYPPEYLEAADEVGLLVQSEMGMLGAWGGHSAEHVYQWPKPTPDNYPVLKRQWDLSVLRDVNHPSANLYCMSNEYGANTHFRRIAWECYHDTKAIKPTALVIWTDGGFNPDLPGDFYNEEATKDIPRDKPLIQHEFRWWSSFPDVRLAERYDGAVRPYAIEIAREAAEQQAQGHLLEVYAENSQHLQLLEAKAKMEACRRDHADLAGICHFDAMDANPSPQGIITEFYERKLADPATWLQTNGDTVVLADLGFDDRVWVSGETRAVTLSVSDFSHPPFTAPEIEWQLTLADDVLASGELSWPHEPCRTCEAGTVRIGVPTVERPLTACLSVRMTDGDRATTNQWRVWLFPAAASPEGAPAEHGENELLVSERLGDTALAHLRTGGTVLLNAGEALVRPHPPNFGMIKYFFTPPANYAPYEDGQNGTVIADHPMLGDFPHEAHADLQFFRMMANSPPIDLEPFGLNDADPVVRVIHRYPVCRPLAYLVERRVGKGRLILCALDLNPQWAEARYLLARIQQYAAAKQKPGCLELGAWQIERLTEAAGLL